jgi:hypothetical protein
LIFITPVEPAFQFDSLFHEGSKVPKNFLFPSFEHLASLLLCNQLTFRPRDHHDAVTRSSERRPLPLQRMRQPGRATWCKPTLVLKPQSFSTKTASKHVPDHRHPTIWFTTSP